jgi:hypothetical protein
MGMALVKVTKLLYKRTDYCNIRCVCFNTFALSEQNFSFYKSFKNKYAVYSKYCLIFCFPLLYDTTCS